MNTNLQNNTKKTQETPLPTTASGELAVTVELLASVGLAADAVFDGYAELCPHCLSRILSEAA